MSKRAAAGLFCLLSLPMVSARAEPAPAARHPSHCEVEMTGQVSFPRGTAPHGPLFIYVAEGDCLSPQARMLGRMQVAPAKSGPTRVFTEVFSSWGADLTVCAAVLDGPGDAPSHLYGKAAGKYHAEAAGEVVFQNIQVTLQPGPPLTLAKPAKP